MRSFSLALLLALSWPHRPAAESPTQAPPLGPIGTKAVYQPATPPKAVPHAIVEVEFSLGATETHNSTPSQWCVLRLTKANGQLFTAWLLTQAPISRNLASSQKNAVRYLTQNGTNQAREFVHRTQGTPVLPTLGAWEHQWPKPKSEKPDDGIAAPQIDLLGQTFTLKSCGPGNAPPCPESPRRIELRPDLMVGVPSNTRTRESNRRFDGSDYPMIRLTRSDYAEMIEAGMNCLRVDAEQMSWIQDEPVFFWGVGGPDVPFPECLYQSNYLGPALFLDEPAVGTRDHDVRPRLAREPELRHRITPQFMFNAFREHFQKTTHNGAPYAFINSQHSRSDVDPGALRFPQANLYTWETMVSTATWQLSGEPESGPCAFVFEPPGRLGTRRTIPEMNMAYGCQLPPANPLSLADTVFGFLRGAARAAGKQWGVSIYGAVDPADAPFLLTHAYDLGATYFFFWDNYQLACVPYTESLALTRILQAHAARHPDRDLPNLLHAADTLIQLPTGYDLGHVQMGRGNLWGLPELNLERRNPTGTLYRQVMATFMTEIERCIRLGIPFDLAWDLDGLPIRGYREIVTVRENARVNLITQTHTTKNLPARTPTRPPGTGPTIHLVLSGPTNHAPTQLHAQARVDEGSSPVYYTTGSDRHGVHPNARVLWELYGPLDEDYRTLLEPGAHPKTTQSGTTWIIEQTFGIQKPGQYRLRASTTDQEGRSATSWTEFVVAP